MSSGDGAGEATSAGVATRPPDSPAAAAADPGPAVGRRSAEGPPVDGTGRAGGTGPDPVNGAGSPGGGPPAAAGDGRSGAEAAGGGELTLAVRSAQLTGGPDPAGSARPPAFEVRLVNFEGPFDLLLTLISKHQLDVTEVALSQVTDEFIAHIRALGSDWDLGQATEFLVIAATLLDLKAARLLPSAEVEDEEDLALLEARDLLFARLLQYRAYKLAAAHLQALERTQSRRFPRAVPLDPRFAELMPELLLNITPEQLARIAADALTPKPPPTVSITHIHAARVSVREHAGILRDRLARLGQSTFRALTQDCEHTVELVARFLALLELFREGAVAFDQVEPLGELWVRWTGNVPLDRPTDGDLNDLDDMDEEYG